MVAVVRRGLTSIIGFTLVVALCFLWSTGYVWGQDTDTGPVNLDVILLMDNSQSMTDTSDPDELRIRAAQLLVDRLSKNAEVFDLRHRVGVVSFGFRVTEITPLTELPNNTVRDSIRAESIPGSDFREPLDVALRQFQENSFGTGSRKAVILFTDGRPQVTDVPLTDPELEAYFKDEAEDVLKDDKGNLTDRIQKLKAEDVRIFVVAIGDDREGLTDEKNWIQLIPKDHYKSLEDLSKMDDAVRSIVNQLTLLVLPSSTAPMPTVTPTVLPSSTPSPTLTPTSISSPTPIPGFTMTPTPTTTPTAVPGRTLGENFAALLVNPLGWGLLVISLAFLIGGGSQWWKARRAEPAIKIHQRMQVIEDDVVRLVQEGRKQDALQKWEAGLKFATGLTTEVVQRIEDLWQLGMERLFTELEEQRERIFHTAGRTDGVVLRGLATYLRGRWAAHPEWALEEIYGFLEHDGRRELLEFVAEAADPEDGSLENARAVGYICKALDQMFTKANVVGDVEEVEEGIRRVRAAFFGAPESFTYTQEGFYLYSCFLSLMKPLSKVEFLDLSPNAPTAWRKALEIYREGFLIRADLKKMQEVLRGVPKQSVKIQGPEGKVLDALAGLWLDRISSFTPKAAELRLALAPELTIQEIDGEIDEETRYPILIENIGAGPALSIRVRMRVYGGRYHIQEKESEFVVDYLNTNEVTVVEFTLTISATEKQAAQAEVEVRYDELKSEKKEEDDETPQLSFHLYLPSTEAISEEDSDFDNPYIADEPVYHEDEPFVGQDREGAISALADVVRSKKSGSPFHIWGIRRIGKTSLLYRFMDQAPGFDCMPVYINCTVFKGEQNLSEPAFWGFLARSIWSRIREEKLLRDVLPDVPKENLSRREFYDFVRTHILRNALQDRTLVLIFDDADVFAELDLQKAGSEKLGSAIVDLLSELSGDRNLQGFFTVLSTENAIGDFWQNRQVSTERRIRLGLLSEAETNQLVKWNGVSLQYSDLAFKYLWRVTGGYPALVQLICHRVIYEWKTGQNRRQTITLPVVRRTVRNLIQDADIEGYFNHVYMYSFTEDERRAMERLVWEPYRLGIDKELFRGYRDLTDRSPHAMEGFLQRAVEVYEDEESRTDRRTLRVNTLGIDKTTLDGLRSKEVLEQRSGVWYWRVGFFELWLERILSSEGTNDQESLLRR